MPGVAFYAPINDNVGTTMLYPLRKKLTLGGVIVGLCLFLGAEVAQAGFGITPPYFRNTSLTRNATYEQQILMVRGNPDQELVADISIDAPEIEDWIEIVEGDEIVLPEGEQRVPMTVRVAVPDDADFREYAGRIRIRTAPSLDDLREGAVNISLGAQVNINLNVIDREIRDFRIRRVSLADLNEGHSVAWLYFPGRIEFTMRLENTGNVPIAPTRVAFDIYDVRGRVLLEETEHLGRIDTVAPYATDEVVAEIPTRLPEGNYIARYTIYNEDEVKQTGELNMSIKPHGTLQQAGFGFRGLSLPHQISIVLPIVSVLILLLYAVYYWRLRRRTHNT